MNNIVKIGSSKKIVNSIASELSICQTDAEKVFDYLTATYQENADEFGRINQSTGFGQGLIAGEGQYYINLPKSIVMVMALILDITFTKGVVLGMCSMLGIQTQFFYNMNQHKGEACLLREYMRRKNMMDAEKNCCLGGKECINNDLYCQFRNEEGICCIQKDDVDKVIIRFREAKIIT